MFHIIDDQPYLCELLADIMETVGCEVKAFTSPQDYLNYVDSDLFIKPIATLTDVDMPVINGYEMMESILKTRPDMRFVVISGEPGIRHEYKHLACMYLLKPFHPDIIETIVKKLKACALYGPDKEIDCISCGDREAFVGSRWSCPQT